MLNKTLNDENTYFRVCNILADTAEEDAEKEHMDVEQSLEKSIKAIEYRTRIILAKRGVI